MRCTPSSLPSSFSSLALLLTLPAAACVAHDTGDDNQDDPQTVSSALEQPNGGLDTRDEAPLFGAQAEFSAAAIESDSVTVDPLASDPTVVAMQEASVSGGFNAIVLWGKIPADRAATDVRDWSGTLAVSRGALLVRHTIAFEGKTDALLPRVSLDAVSFHSVTRPHADGLALTILDPDASATTSQTLTYTSADGATIYTIDTVQFAAGPVVVDAGNGDKLIVAGLPRRADACARGFMRGRWHALSDQLGTVLGVVTDDAGAQIGHVRGVYGQRLDGQVVLYAKFIAADGQFRGILAGSYDGGEYHTRWIDRQGDHGTAHGVYFAGAAATAGQFLGRWSETGCAADPAPSK